MWHALALFVKNSKDKYIKPTEGISEQTYRALKPLYKNGKGFWLWICSSKETDVFRNKKDRKSYLMGAVYIAGSVRTREYRNTYKRYRAMSEYSHSKDFDFQLIIPMDHRCRLELSQYIPIHKCLENRQSGVWKPAFGVPLYHSLIHATFL